MTFLPKKMIFSQNAPAYRALLWLFCQIIHSIFAPKIPKKLIFPQIANIIQGTLLTFLPKKLIFSSKCDCVSSTILTFLQNNPLCLTPKTPKKLIFPQIATIILGTLLPFRPKKVIFSSKCACISSTILTFLQNNPVCFYTKNSQKVNFSSNCDYNTGHFIDFSPKKSDFFLKMRLHIEHYFDFFAQ